MALPRNTWKWVTLLTGLGLFVWVLAASDLRHVAGLLAEFRWGFALVFLFYGLIFGLDTLGWKFALHPEARRISWFRLFRARLAGEALNYVTPTASLGGEPVKAWILSRRHGVKVEDGVASVVIAKTTFSISMLLFVALGVVITLATQQTSPALMRWVWIVLPTLAALMGFFVLAQFLQPFRRGTQLVERWMPGWLRQLLHKVHEWDRAIVAFYKSSPSSVFWSLGFHFLGWVAGAVEVYLIFFLLGLPVSWATAFSLEALWVLLRSGAFVIPGSLGASEGFLLLICSGLGVSAIAGLSLGLIRRVREVAWTGLGLLEFSRGA